MQPRKPQQLNHQLSDRQIPERGEAGITGQRKLPTSNPSNTSNTYLLKITQNVFTIFARKMYQEVFAVKV